MSKQTNGGFRFFPRPEANPTNWEDLLSPVQSAVRGLLLRIKGSIETVNSNEWNKGDSEAWAEVASCFLVYGDRGTGKTTVLLSARKACMSEKKFFDETRKGACADDLGIDLCADIRTDIGIDIHADIHADIGGDTRADAQDSAKALKNVQWLDVLDLEPLPRGTNFLTTVLTRVRNALYPSGSDEHSRETRSILEEGADSARHQLDKLIADAALMWEEIREQDTRSRANREVAAAGIYAEFRQRFLRAMCSLSRELARLRGISDEGCPIILPIDNIDRSTDHLYSIVKLAQMVNCRELWLVMAGDRQDVETFLERAYWKELIQIGESAGARGKSDASGEDEALAMARRQAAAALHKLLPPSHRVEVELVESKETLKFSPRNSLGQSREGHRSIKALLERIPVTDPARKDENKLTLIDLFDAGKLFEKALGQEKTLAQASRERRLTTVAQLALRLPARSVLDLWQIADWIARDEHIVAAQKAAVLARTMLRNIVTESTISNRQGRYLLEQMIKFGAKKEIEGTLMDVGCANRGKTWLKADRLWSYDFYVALPAKNKDGAENSGVPDEASPYEVKSALEVMKTSAAMLSLCENTGPKGEIETNATMPSLCPKSDPKREVDCTILPDPVAGWLAVLHDALVSVATWRRVGRPTVIGQLTLPPAAKVSAQHWGVVIDRPRAVDDPLSPLSDNRWLLAWQVPNWGTFVADDLWRQLWEDFLSDLKEPRDLTSSDQDEKVSWADLAGRDGCLSSLLCAGWVGCALDTFSAVAPVELKVAGGNLGRVIDSIKLVWKENPIKEAVTAEAVMAKAVMAAEVKVMEAAADCYAAIRERNSHGTVYQQEKGAWHIMAWLIEFLPLLLSHLYVPLPDERANDRAKKIIEALGAKQLQLAKDWKDNAPYYLAGIDLLLAKLFPSAKPASTEGQKEHDSKTPYLGDIKGLKPFFNLHRLWSPDSNS